MLLLQLHTFSVLAKKDFVRGYKRTPALSPVLVWSFQIAKTGCYSIFYFYSRHVAKSLVVYRQNIEQIHTYLLHLKGTKGW